MAEGFNNYIISEQPYVLYGKLKLHCRGSLFKYLLGFCIIYFALNWVPEILGMVFTTSYVDLFSKVANIDEAVKEQLPSTPVVIYIAAFFLNGVFALGQSLYSLTYIRNKEIEYRAVFEGFSFYFKALGLYIMKSCMVFLGTVFFIVPGIVLAISLSQCFYIMADDPNKGILEIVAESNLRMRGNKMTYFKFFLLYVPFIFAAYIPAAAFSWFTDISTSTISGMFILLILEIPMYFAMGYFELGKASFYELLKNEGFENFKYAGQDAFRDNNIEVV